MQRREIIERFHGEQPTFVAIESCWIELRKIER